MNPIELDKLDWQKMNNLIPAIIQHAENGKVLMLAYMNQDALLATQTSGLLTLFSRSKNRLWQKGETSGHSMKVINISTDCDQDSLLVQVLPQGPACHLGYVSCYQLDLMSSLGFIDSLVELINQRAKVNSDNSYTAQLIASGIKRCAQKVGEEAVETVIAAVSHDRKELIEESADLIFHLLVLFKVCELSVYEVVDCLKQRDLRTHT